MGIRALGLDDSVYSGHSFHIGALTIAARLRLGEEVIQRIGHWESMRFRSYVRLDKWVYGLLVQLSECTFQRFFYPLCFSGSRCCLL